jgi:hypothetical protein
MSPDVERRAAAHLIRLTGERQAICKALGVVNDASLDLPAVAHALKVRDERQVALLRRIDLALSQSVVALDFVSLRQEISTEVPR